MAEQTLFDAWDVDAQIHLAALEQNALALDNGSIGYPATFRHRSARLIDVTERMCLVASTHAIPFKSLRNLIVLLEDDAEAYGSDWKWIRAVFNAARKTVRRLTEAARAASGQPSRRTAPPPTAVVPQRETTSSTRTPDHQASPDAAAARSTAGSHQERVPPRKEATTRPGSTRPGPSAIDATARRFLSDALKASEDSGIAYLPARCDIAAAVSKELKHPIMVEALFGKKQTARGREYRYPQFMQLWEQLRETSRNARRSRKTWE